MALYNRQWTEANGIIPSGYGTTRDVLVDSDDDTIVYLACDAADGSGGLVVVYIDPNHTTYPDGQQYAYADLPYACALTQDAGYVYVGTGLASGTGVHRIAKSTLGLPIVADPAVMQGDVTPAPWNAYLTTITTPAIKSNEIATRGLAFNDALSRMCISCGQLSIAVTLTDPFSAVYDSIDKHLADGPVVCDGDLAYWAYNGGDVPIVYKLQDVTSPSADDFYGKPLFHVDDPLDDSSFDTGRWYTWHGGASLATSEGGAGVRVTFTRADAAGYQTGGFASLPRFSANDFTVRLDFNDHTFVSEECNYFFDMHIYNDTATRLFKLSISLRDTDVHFTVDEDGVGTVYNSGAVAIGNSNWETDGALWLERSGTTFRAYYRSGGGGSKTQAGGDYTDGGNTAGNMLRPSIYHQTLESVPPHNTASYYDLTAFALEAPTEYDSLWTDTINDISFAGAVASNYDVLGVGTTAGLYKLYTASTTTWAGWSSFTQETYGKASSGADHEIINGASNDVTAVAVASDALNNGGHVLFGTGGGGAQAIDFADDSLLGYFNTSGGYWGGEANAQDTTADTITAVAYINEANDKFTYGGSGGAITPDVDAPGEVAALGAWGDYLDSLLTRWELAADADIDHYELERCDKNDDATWNRFKDDETWDTSGTYYEFPNLLELCALRIPDLDEGRYKVRVRAVDFAANEGDWTTSGWLYLGAPSELTPVIEGGALRTLTRAVEIEINGKSHADSGAISNEGIDEVAFSNDAGLTWSEWRNWTGGAANTYDHTLSSGNGSKTVYVKARDEAGNESSNYTCSISLSESAAMVTTSQEPMLAAFSVTHFEGDAGTITSNSEITGYDDDNVILTDLGRAWRGSIAATPAIMIDLGSAKTIHVVGIFSIAYSSGLLGSVDTLKVQASNTSPFPVLADYEVDVTDQIGLSQIVVPIVDGETYRYWRLNAATCTGSGYLNVGRIVVSSAWQPEINFDDPHRFSLDDPSTIHDTAQGQRRGRIKDVRRGYRLPFKRSTMTLSDQQTLTTLFKACGTLRPVVVVPDPSSVARASETAVYGYLAPGLDFDRYTPSEYAHLTLEVEEITG